jgi:hypothetical protein
VSEESQLRLLRKAFSDISRGYSVAFFNNRKLFIKHLSHHEQVDLDVLYKQFLDEGSRDGLPSQEYMLSHLKEQGVWTEKDDKELEEIKARIDRLVAGKKVIYLKSDLDRQNKDIETEEKKYVNKKMQKERLLGTTAEAFAEKKVNEHYILQSFFLDNNLSRPFIAEDYYDKPDDGLMPIIIRLYNEEMETVSDRNIKKLALQEFFQVYWSLSSENLFYFFNRPICDLTYFQIKLGSYGRMFRGILEKAEGIPEDIRNDPDKLLDYVRTGENAKEKMQGSVKEGADPNAAVASTLIGAKNEDYKAVGMKSDPSVTSLTEALKKKKNEGKKGLNMQDMMKLMGH